MRTVHYHQNETGAERGARNYIKITYQDHSNMAQLCIPPIYTWTMWNNKTHNVTLI
jgi:hypothetical protein